MTTGVNTMLAVFLVPLRDTGRFVHVLDDLAPADSRVVRAEGDFAKLRRIRDDAHLRAAEVVVEQILDPHSRHEQEVPRIAATPLDVVHCAVARDFSVTLAGQAKGFIELP